MLLVPNYKHLRVDDRAASVFWAALLVGTSARLGELFFLQGSDCLAQSALLSFLLCMFISLWFSTFDLSFLFAVNVSADGAAYYRPGVS